MPEWQAYYDSTGNLAFQLAGVSDDDEDETATFTETYGITFPVIIDPKREISSKFKVKYRTLAFLLDENRTVMFYQKYGQSTLGAIAEIDKLLRSGKRINGRKGGFGRTRR